MPISNVRRGTGEKRIPEKFLHQLATAAITSKLLKAVANGLSFAVANLKMSILLVMRGLILASGSAKPSTSAQKFIPANDPVRYDNVISRWHSSGQKRCTLVSVVVHPVLSKRGGRIHS